MKLHHCEISMPDGNQDKNQGSRDDHFSELDYHIKLPSQTHPTVY